MESTVNNLNNSTQEVNLLIRYHYRDYKRTQQGVPNILLPYFYYRYMVHANNK